MPHAGEDPREGPSELHCFQGHVRECCFSGTMSGHRGDEVFGPIRPSLLLVTAAAVGGLAPHDRVEQPRSLI